MSAVCQLSLIQCKILNIVTCYSKRYTFFIHKNQSAKLYWFEFFPLTAVIKIILEPLPLCAR